MSVSSVGVLFGCHTENLTQGQTCAKRVFQAVLGMICAVGLVLVGLPLGGYVPSYCYWVGGGIALLTASLLLTSCLHKSKSSESSNASESDASLVETPQNVDVALAQLRATVFNSDQEYAGLKVGSQVTIKLFGGAQIPLSINLEQAQIKHLKFYLIEHMVNERNGGSQDVNLNRYRLVYRNKGLQDGRGLADIPKGAIIYCVTSYIKPVALM